jgi:predicted SAM-dependent methyltransferase
MPASGEGPGPKMGCDRRGARIVFLPQCLGKNLPDDCQMLQRVRHHCRVAAEQIVMRYGYELRRVRGEYQSETSKARQRLARFCVGNGIDLGAGGDPITESAIRIDLATPYARAGILPTQLSGDASDLFWFRDATLDYVYSSHLLEDFIDTRSVLIEWLRVIKPMGKLIILCPDEQVYRQHCAMTGQEYNSAHRHADFSIQKIKHILLEIGGTKIIHEAFPVDIYSWELVVQKSA